MKVYLDSYQKIEMLRRFRYKIFLEFPTVFQLLLDYINILSKDSRIITNIMQVDFRHTKYANSFVNDIVLPLYVYFDEIDVGNPLGIVMPELTNLVV